MTRSKQSILEEALGGSGIPPGGQQKIDGGTS
jgi:hypothetical protein